MHGQDIAIHSLLIIRRSNVVLDASFYPYDGQRVHNLASVTKSVMTTLIGIAVDQGKIHLDDPLVSFFTDQSIAHLDPRKQQLTVRQLASMAGGMESTCLGDNVGQSHMDCIKAPHGDNRCTGEERHHVAQAGTDNHEAFCLPPRPMGGNATQHLLGDILVIAICAVICGADGWVEVVAWGNAKRPWLEQFLELPNGIPP